MKYASVVIPLVIVGVLFLCGCIWVATRTRNDDGDEESIVDRDEPLRTAKQVQPSLHDHHAPSRAHSVTRPSPAVLVPPLPTSTHSLTSVESPPRYER
ncbi:hypothetical protein BDV93DRAFT_529649 [Ceratobasidium sp. AG-I]|nr:hypothetical protein BDV93DRAFT_529649 [Ceratobasidium sp. AG-I]